MSIKTVEAPGGQGSGASLDYFKNNLREYGMLVALVAIILFFAAYSAATGRPTFVSASNLTNCSSRTATSSSWRSACC